MHTKMHKKPVTLNFEYDLKIIGADFHRAMVANAPGRITPHRAPPYGELDLIHEFAYLF